MVDEVSGSMEGQQAACGASIRSRMSSNSTTLPPSGDEILHGGVQGSLLQVSFLKEHDGVSLSPNPVLHLFAKEGDVGKGDGEGLFGRYSETFLRLEPAHP